MHLDVVTFIYKLFNFNLEEVLHLWTCLHVCELVCICVNWSVFVCGSLRLFWRGWIHGCIFFNKELSLANQMAPSFSANWREELLRESAYGNNPFLFLSLFRVKAKVPFPQFLLHHGRDNPHYESLLVVEVAENLRPDAVFIHNIREYPRQFGCGAMNE